MKIKKILSILLILFIVVITSSAIFAADLDQGGGGPGYGDTYGNGYGSGFDFNQVPSGNIDQVGNTKGIFDNVFTTVLLLIQIASVAGIVFCGIRYMYASADKKADLKSGLVPLTIGIVLVFGASTVAQFVIKVFTQAT